MNLNPRNILIINFGQLGDVVLSLPALRLIRERFPHARITIAAGSSTAPIVELSGYVDEIIPVDRVALRDNSKALSVLRILDLVRQVRSRSFDFVIDLHSLSETNLLGYVSGARRRLYANRPGRSLNVLANVRGVPVEDNSKHAVDRYLDVLAPLGTISELNVERIPRLRTRDEDGRFIDELLRKKKVKAGVPLVGMFPGAGHPSRRWSLANFGELSRRFTHNDGVQTIIFAGPEESALVPEMRSLLPASVTILDRLTLPQLAAALARLSVFICNETGPVHIAAAVGTPVVVLFNRLTPNSFTPLGEGHESIYTESLASLTVDEVYAAARRTFARERTTALFMS